MTTNFDSRVHATAVKAALDTAVGPDPVTSKTRVFDYDDVPGWKGNAGTPPTIFALVSLERRYNPPERISARAGTTSWRVAVRGIGTTIDEARWAMFHIAQALNEKRLTIAGTTTTSIQLESEQAPEEDDDRYSGTSVWTFVH